jgi:hypothetical protein
MRLGHQDLYHPPLNLRGNCSCDGFEGHLRPGNTVHKGKTGHTPPPIAAHLRFASVGVEESPPEITTGGGDDEDQAVGSYGFPAPARPRRQRCHLLFLHPSAAVVDQDEVVPAPVHFPELDLFQFTLAKTEIKPPRRQGKISDFHLQSLPAGENQMVYLFLAIFAPLRFMPFLGNQGSSHP